MLVFYFIILSLQKNVYETDPMGTQLTINGNEYINQEDINKLDYTRIERVQMSGITGINTSAFTKCSQLFEVLIPSTCKEILSFAFKSCSRLQKVIISEGVESIGKESFASTNITELIIPSSITNIETKFLALDARYLSKIYVSPNNSNFSSDSNNLFLLSADKKTLYFSVIWQSELTIPYYVESLHDYSLYSINANKISFTTDSNLLTVNSYAFGQCFFRSIIFPSRVTTIRSQIFYQSSSIINVSLPASLTSLDPSAFDDARTLTNVFVDPGCDVVASVDNVLYSKDLKKVIFIPHTIKNVTFLKSVEWIGSTAIQFSGLEYACVGNDSVKYESYEGIIYTDGYTKLFACPGKMGVAKIHPNCQKVENLAFKMCSVSEINFNGANVTSLGFQTFCLCNNIKQIVLPKTLQTIGHFCFQITPNLTVPIDFPASLKSIGESAFIGSNIPTFNFSKCVLLKSFGSAVFSGSKIKSIHLPPNIEEVPDNTFQGCKSLSVIEFNQQLKRIGASAFAYCASLGIVNLSSTNLTEVDDEAFSSSSISSIVFPPTIEYVLSGALRNTKNLLTVDFGGKASQLKKASSSVFDGSGVQSVYYGDHLSSVDEGALTGAFSMSDLKISNDNPWFEAHGGVIYKKGCVSLVACAPGVKEVFVHGEVRKIESKAFLKCKVLKAVNFSNVCPLEDIVISSFEGCVSLSHILLPHSLVSIGSRAFKDCSNLISVTFDSSPSLSSIDSFAFSGCNLLKKVDLGDSLKSVSNSAFVVCSSLDSIRLPSALESLGMAAFSGCSSLRLIRFCGLGNFDSTAFTGCPVERVEVPIAFSGSTFCGFEVSRILGNNCAIPTELFTGAAFSQSSAGTIASYVLVGDRPSENS